ncbi:MAG TPA: AAA family ATPase [Gaiellaceae bacterium]
MPVLVGRDQELEAVDELLRDAESPLGGLELVGEPGIGKTTLWQEAVRRAEARGMRVLAARPAASEARLTFAALGDLLADVDEEMLARLPSPQRDAIDAALLRAEARRSPNRQIVGTALLSVLRELSAAGPVLIAVDDAQWLDRPTAAALEFALRRLERAPVRVVASRRADATRPSFVSALADDRVRRVVVGPLSLAALQRIISERLSVTLPRPVLVRLTEACRGNAFYALEIARLLAGALPAPSSPLPVPDDLRALVTRRIASLPAPTRRALLTAAALARPTVEHVDVEALDAASAAGLVEVDRAGAISFAHPLFAAAVYAAASPAELTSVHRRLAETVVDVEERARHLALATDGPDTEAAHALDAAAERARARGAPDTAAELAELALRLTEDGPAAAERRLRFADHLYLAGDFLRAASVLEEIAEADAGEVRARALLALADIDYWRKGESAAVGHVERALAATTDPLVEARCHASIAMWAGTSDLRRASDAAQHALRVLERREDADPGLLSLALSARVRADLFLGLGLDRAAADLALELEQPAPPPAVDTRVVFKLGQWLRYVDDFDGARRHLELAERAAVEEGDDSSLANILLNRALLECWSGNWGRAAALADRTHEQFTLNGVAAGSSFVWRAYVDAHLGEPVAADGAAAIDEPVTRMLWDRAVGLARLAAGDYAEAWPRLEAAVVAREQIGFREPAVWRIEGDAVEAAIGAGELAPARRVLATLEEAAGRSRIPWNRAVAARCRGLLCAAEGDVEGAADELDRALAEHASCPMPFELARTLLAAGQVRRRLKQKRLAREHLDRAARLFDELGARPWAGRARDEHARTASRSAPDDLTPTELRIALLAASGLTNEAIASEVFVSRKTVEANLGRAYRKLGIRTRAQLGRALDAREREAIP